MVYSRIQLLQCRIFLVLALAVTAVLCSEVYTPVFKPYPRLATTAEELAKTKPLTISRLCATRLRAEPIHS